MENAQSVAARIAETIRKLPQSKRQLIAMAGPPAAGKSTISKALVAELGDSAALVPLDGFHFSNDILDARDLRARKGAPESFDLAGFSALLERLRTEAEVAVPTFNRALDVSIGSSVLVKKHHNLIIVEGNYLLLDEPGWRDLKTQWDLSVALNVPEEVLEQRLIQRWLDHGLSAKDARTRAMSNDIPNARRVARNQTAADLRI
ncbi:AAA family ATPase [Rhodobacteraceae bacterium]|nr:AAA family ATPase [Paracoccaceae bacterium]